MTENSENPASLQILSLEDSPIDFEIISEKLISSGFKFNIERVDTEIEFTAHLRNNKYDLILADFNLPGFDAFEALKIAIQFCPNTPFICVSGSIGEITAIELLKNGAIDYVLKNRLERLPFAVNRALKEVKEMNALKLAEEELKRNEAKFRTLTEHIPDIIARFDKDFKHLYINPSIEKVYGIPSDQFIGKTNEELGMPMEKVEVWNEKLKYVFATGKQLNFEFEFDTSAGTLYYSSMLIPELTEEGKVKTVLGVTRDITENKLAEVALRKSEERFRDIIFSSADWVWEIDAEGKYTYSSQKSMDFFAASHDEIIGKTPFDFMPKDEAEKIAPIFNGIVANKEPIVDLENWNIGKNGERICLLTNGLPILDEKGQLLGYRGIDKNITERKLSELELIKAKEKAEESDKLKTAFINNISHEIRTPLNGILGFGQFLTESDLSVEQRLSYFDILQKSSRRLMNTISDYIDMARIVSGTMEVHKKEFLLQPVFMDIVENTKYLCAEKNIEFDVVIPEKTNNIILYSDGEIIGKILNNLLNNAIKFTKQGRINCGYSLNSGFLEFYVNDTGCGIAPDKLDLIFEMFTQEDVSISRGYEGSGLGLSIAGGLVKLLGGTITVTSEKEIGSSFTFTVPYVATEPLLADISEPEIKTELRKPLVLIAEDEDSNFLYFEYVMKLIECDYLRANDGAEAVEICKKNSDITLILMDIQMPVMNGLEATWLIHEFRPDLPVVAVTAYAQTGDEYRCRAAGCNDYLSKPVKKDKLLSLLHKYI